MGAAAAGGGASGGGKRPAAGATGAASSSPSIGPAPRLSYAELDVWLQNQLVLSAMPPCGSLVARCKALHPVTLGGFYRLLHHLVTVMGYPVAWFAR